MSLVKFYKKSVPTWWIKRKIYICEMSPPITKQFHWWFLPSFYLGIFSFFPKALMRSQISLHRSYKQYISNLWNTKKYLTLRNEFTHPQVVSQVDFFLVLFGDILLFLIGINGLQSVPLQILQKQCSNLLSKKKGFTCEMNPHISKKFNK